MSIIDPIELESRFKPGLDEIILFDKKTLEDQGHKDTGALENSLKYVLKITPTDISIDFYSLNYGQALDTGVPAKNVRYGYHHVVGWARRKHPGITDKELNKFIYSMMNVHKQEGIPTDASKRFSKTGERTGWIRLGTEFIDQNFDRFFPIDDIVDKLFEVALEDFLA